MSQDAENVIDRFNGIIPEVFYDLIARIIPGVIITTTYSIVNSKLQNQMSQDNQYSFFKMIVFAYFVGFIFDLLSGFLLEGSAYTLIVRSRYFSKHLIETKPMWKSIQKLESYQKFLLISRP